MRTFANEQAYREKRIREGYTNPGTTGGPIAAPEWDAFWGSLEANRDDAHAAGRGFRAVMPSGGAGMGPMASLRRAAGNDFDATEYQMGRAALDRTLNDNFARKWQQRGALSDADRARDPMARDFEDNRQREQAEKDAATKDRITADSFDRLEGTRRMDQREKRMAAEEMLPYNAAVIQSRLKAEGVFDTNDARRDAATASAQARTGAAAMNSLARAAGTQTFGDPTMETRVTGAIDAIKPNVPGGDGLRQLPPEWDFNLVLEKFGGNEKQAEEWLRLSGYRR